MPGQKHHVRLTHVTRSCAKCEQSKTGQWGPGNLRLQVTCCGLIRSDDVVCSHPLKLTTMHTMLFGSSLVPKPFLCGQGKRGERRKGLVKNSTLTRSLPSLPSLTHTGRVWEPNLAQYLWGYCFSSVVPKILGTS